MRVLHPEGISVRNSIYEFQLRRTGKERVYLIGDQFLPEKHTVSKSDLAVFAIDPIEITITKEGTPIVTGFADQEISDIICREKCPVFIFQQWDGHYWGSFGGNIVDFVRDSMQEYSKKKRMQAMTGVRPIMPYKKIEDDNLLRMSVLYTYISHFSPSTIEVRAPNKMKGDARKKAEKLIRQLEVFNRSIQYSVIEGE